jgi:hypothetical protein
MGGPRRHSTYPFLLSHALLAMTLLKQVFDQHKLFKIPGIVTEMMPQFMGRMLPG